MAACIPRARPWGAARGAAPLWTRLGSVQVGARGAAARQRPPAARILGAPFDEWAKGPAPDLTQATMHGFWFFDYADADVSLERFSATDRMVTVGGRLPNYVAEEGTFIAGARYRVERALELLDTPNEFFINESTGVLYVYPTPEIIAAGWEGMELSVATNALALVGVSHVTVSGFAIGQTRGDAVSLVNCSHVKLEDLVVRNAGLHGVSIDHGNDIQLLSSEVRRLRTSPACAPHLRTQQLGVASGGAYSRLAGERRGRRTANPGAIRAAHRQQHPA